MRVLFVSFLFLYAHIGIYGEKIEGYIDGWHAKVGMKNAEMIKKYEEGLMDRIVGGTIAPVAAHPYLVGLIIDIRGMNSPSACGGSLLTSNRILTAAHCWYDGVFQAWKFTAVLGSPFLFHGGLRVKPHKISIHPQYDSRTFANDIAMLYTPVRVPFSLHISPIRLPSGDLLKEHFSEEWTIAAGFGRYSDLTNPTMNTMARYVFLQVITLDRCRSYYGGIVLDSNICTNGEGGVGICQGDSGGPLAVIVNGEPVLVGVSSFVALDGCELGFPSVFAKVSSFIDWIRVQL